MTNPYEDALLGKLGQKNTGVTGQMGQAGAPPLQVEGPAPVAQPSGVGAFANKLEGFDAGKLSSGHDSPKYQFGRVLSQFDPKGGVTQDMLDALNALGLGTVSGTIGGDKISIGGNVDPRFQGVTEFDIIRDLEHGGGFQWQGLNGRARDGMGPSGGALAGLPNFGALAGASLNNLAEPSEFVRALLASLGQ